MEGSRLDVCEDKDDSEQVVIEAEPLNNRGKRLADHGTGVLFTACVTGCMPVGGR
jgi:hypothetical protein